MEDFPGFSLMNMVDFPVSHGRFPPGIATVGVLTQAPKCGWFQADPQPSHTIAVFSHHHDHY